MSSIFLKVLTVIMFALMVLAPAARADSTEEAIERAARMNASVVRIYKEGRIEEALEAGERAYNTIAETLGPEHPGTATALYNLAVLFEEMGKLRRAEALFARALEIRKVSLGVRNRDTIKTRRKLAALRKVLAGPTVAAERKPSAKIMKNGGGHTAPLKTTAPTVKAAPVRPKIVDTGTIKSVGKQPRAKILPRPAVVPRSIGSRGRAPASANGGREHKTSARIAKKGSVGNAAASAVLKEVAAENEGAGGEEEAPALETRSLAMVIEEDGKKPEPAASKDVDLEEYKVKLGVDALMKIPGPAGLLRVWIGAPEYIPEFRAGMSEAVSSLPRVGETAKVKAFAPDFEVKPKDSICIKLHRTGTDALFELRPKKKGEFKVSAVVELFDSKDCSGAAIPKAVETLQVMVKVDTGEVVGERAAEVWEVFWEKFLDFWGAIVALFFGLILFLLRGKLKKIFGFGGDKS